MRVSMAILLMLGLAGCGNDDSISEVAPDDLTAPFALRAIAADGQVTLSWWCHNVDPDLLGYKIFGISETGREICFISE